jgi:hypothetical protein
VGQFSTPFRPPTVARAQCYISVKRRIPPGPSARGPMRPQATHSVKRTTILPCTIVPASPALAPGPSGVSDLLTFPPYLPPRSSPPHGRNRRRHVTQLPIPTLRFGNNGARHRDCRRLSPARAHRHRALPDRPAPSPGVGRGGSFALLRIGGQPKLARRSRNGNGGLDEFRGHRRSAPSR